MEASYGEEVIFCKKVASFELVLVDKYIIYMYIDPNKRYVYMLEGGFVTLSYYPITPHA